MTSGFHKPTGFQSGGNIQPQIIADNTRLVKRDLNNVYDPNELLEILYDENSIYNNMGRDLKSIQEFINGKKSNKYREFMYQESAARNNVNAEFIQSHVDPTRSSDAFIISDTGNTPEAISDVSYRITLRNSDNLKNDDVLSFIQAFKNEAQKRETHIRCKIRFNESDGIIFYTDKENLLETVKLLEDLKDEKVYGSNVTNAIRNFGKPQPFSATLSEDSYYSIAMRGVEPNSSRLKSTLGGGLLRTFNEYMDDSLDFAYNQLLSKYGNDANKINAGELYKEMITYHANRMGVGEAIPLWMNNRMYEDLNSRSHSL